jgi:hypothetical protein
MDNVEAHNAANEAHGQNKHKASLKGTVKEPRELTPASSKFCQNFLTPETVTITVSFTVTPELPTLITTVTTT